MIPDTTKKEILPQQQPELYNLRTQAVTSINVLSKESPLERNIIYLSPKTLLKSSCNNNTNKKLFTRQMHPWF